MERDHRPQPLEAPLDHGIGGDGSHSEQQPSTPRAEYDVIQGKLAEMHGKKPSTDYFLLTLKRRVLEKEINNPAEKTSVEDMRGQLGGIISEAKYTRNEEVQTAINKLDWAFLTLTAQNDREIITYYDIQKYNEMQRKFSEQGQVAQGVELSPELTQHLAWMVDRVQLPYDIGEEAICIPFASLEQNMGIASRTWNDALPLDLDHEKTTSVMDLMQEWNNSQENQQG